MATKSSRKHALSRLSDVMLAATLCVTAAVVVQQAVVLFAADWSSSSVRHQLGLWTQGTREHTDAQWELAQQDLTRAVALTPNDPTLHDALAQLHGLRGQTLWTTGAEGSPELEAYRAALEHQQASLRIRPTHAMAWANLALFHLALNSPPEDLLKAWREAARLGPKEIDVENTLASVANDIWPIAPPDMKAWVEARRPGWTEAIEKLATQGAAAAPAR